MKLIQKILEWLDDLLGEPSPLLFKALVFLAPLLAVAIISLVIFLIIWTWRRREEEAALFLDLAEQGLFDDPAAWDFYIHDRTLGPKFQHLRVRLRQGLKLSAALEEVPGLVPSQIAGMLKTGEQLGDLRRIIPACRKLMAEKLNQDPTAPAWVIPLFSSQIMVGIMGFLNLKIVPVMEKIEIERLTPESDLPWVSNLVFHHGLEIFTVVQGSLVLFFIIAGVLNRWPWLRPDFPTSVVMWIDSILHRFPWRRRRMQRDFTAMLGLLLDAHVPEEQAIRIAAEAAANESFRQRAERAVERLRQGVALPKALCATDDSGEFQWRLRTAFHLRGSFATALAGWHDSLDVKAALGAHAASRFTLAALVLFASLIAGSMAVAVFQVLTGIVMEIALW